MIFFNKISRLQKRIAIGQKFFTQLKHEMIQLGCISATKHYALQQILDKLLDNATTAFRLHRTEEAKKPSHKKVHMHNQKQTSINFHFFIDLIFFAFSNRIITKTTLTATSMLLMIHSHRTIQQIKTIPSIPQRRARKQFR